MTKDQIFNFLGLAMRAGKIKSGESVILSDIKTNKLNSSLLQLMPLITH